MSGLNTDVNMILLPDQTACTERQSTEATEKDNCWFLWSSFCFNDTFSLIQEWWCGHIINGALCLKPGWDLGSGPVTIQMLAPQSDPFSCGQRPCRWWAFPTVNKENHGQERCFCGAFVERAKQEKNVIRALTDSKTFRIAVQHDLSWLNGYVNGNMLNI